MAILRNLPTDEPKKFANLLTPKQNQIVSMNIFANEDLQLSIFTFANKETVSEEEYIGDTMYFILEGETYITIGDKPYTLKAGDVFKVPAHTFHGIGGKDEFKMLQLTVKETTITTKGIMEHERIN